ncbi:hypothetical protein LMG33818_000537 [Halomonadaceae bacterium LMG 33818]|uniref:isochorismatase family protein n=1 Tax=Cernens ardua TaxID=3402176 RepID=UPI003EDC3120
MTKALIVIGMQQHVLNRIQGGADYKHHKAMANAPRIIEAFREASLDVIHVLHEDKAPHLPLHVDAEGYPPIQDTMAEDQEHVFVKHTASIFSSTAINQLLKEKGISELFLIGSDLHSSILHTVPTAMDMEYKVDVVSDAVIGFGFHDRGISADMAYGIALSCIEADGGHIIDTETLLETMAANEGQEN